MGQVYQELLTAKGRALLEWLKPAVRLTHDLQAIDAELYDLQKTGDEYDAPTADAIRALTEHRSTIYRQLAWYRLRIMDLINATDFRATQGYQIRERTAALVRHIAIDHFVRGIYVTSLRGDYSIQTRYNLKMDTAKRLYRSAINLMAQSWDGSTPTPND